MADRKNILAAAKRHKLSFESNGVKVYKDNRLTEDEAKAIVRCSLVRQSYGDTVDGIDHDKSLVDTLGLNTRGVITVTVDGEQVEIHPFLR